MKYVTFALKTLLIVGTVALGVFFDNQFCMRLVQFYYPAIFLMLTAFLFMPGQEKFSHTKNAVLVQNPALLRASTIWDMCIGVVLIGNGHPITAVFCYLMLLAEHIMVGATIKVTSGQLSTD